MFCFVDSCSCVITPLKLSLSAFSFLLFLACLSLWSAQVCLIWATGREIEAVLQYVYAHHVGRGGFLQTDSRLDFDAATMTLRAVAGAPAAADRRYSVAVPLTQLKGMDDNPQLVSIGKRNDVGTLMVDDLLLLQQVVISYLSSKAGVEAKGADAKGADAAKSE